MATPPSLLHLCQKVLATHLTSGILFGPLWLVLGFVTVFDDRSIFKENCNRRTVWSCIVFLVVNVKILIVVVVMKF